jgi:flagellar basal-body rod protein FlgB
MRTSLDHYLGVHPLALQLEAKRNELLAANLANADTPNYKARDIDFKTALATAGGSGAPAPTSQNSLPLRGAVGAGTTGTAAAATGPNVSDTPTGGIDPSLLRYRVPMAPALDGNTVDEQLEQSAFAENYVRHEATMAFLNSALRDLMLAITGS